MSLDKKIKDPSLFVKHVLRLYHVSGKLKLQRCVPTFSGACYFGGDRRIWKEGSSVKHPINCNTKANNFRAIRKVYGI